MSGACFCVWPLGWNEKEYLDMAQDDDDMAAVPTGCCVIDTPDGVQKFDNFTEKACRDAASHYGLPWHFYPNTSCSSV